MSTTFKDYEAVCDWPAEQSESVVGTVMGFSFIALSPHVQFITYGKFELWDVGATGGINVYAGGAAAMAKVHAKREKGVLKSVD